MHITQMSPGSIRVSVRFGSGLSCGGRGGGISAEEAVLSVHRQAMASQSPLKLGPLGPPSPFLSLSSVTSCSSLCSNFPTNRSLRTKTLELPKDTKISFVFSLLTSPRPTHLSLCPPPRALCLSLSLSLSPSLSLSLSFLSLSHSVSLAHSLTLSLSAHVFCVHAYHAMHRDAITRGGNEHALTPKKLGHSIRPRRIAEAKCLSKRRLFVSSPSGAPLIPLSHAYAHNIPEITRRT